MDTVKKWDIDVFTQEKENEIREYLLNTSGSVSVETTWCHLEKILAPGESVFLYTEAGWPITVYADHSVI